MNEVLGRNTAMLADVKDHVDIIKSIQATQVVELAQFKMTMTTMTTDIAEMKATCTLHEARTKKLEDESLERKTKLKFLAALWGGGTTLLGGIVLYGPKMLKFLGW
ncbi:hypothetical protein [Dyadobacter psychrotolerans]|uniref:Uncharacterized protein n=1 Tax=Dyadobacter psychrotolerans TaxID=2541721 RepID=A0A4V2Z526_9BACT|nr:hypothetical protein [Dyadobacter psychrotolerans]TDE17728.1 hypothetical protein E0F88_07505 [Dyadobacter psychrotolerans]